MAFFSRRKPEQNFHKTEAKPAFFSWEMNSIQFTILLSSVFVIFYNIAFFHALAQVVDFKSIQGFLFGASITLLVALVTALVLSMIVLPFIAKPFVMFTLIAAASAAYFMNAYGIVIHATMIQNTLETDSKEASALFSSTLAMYLLLLGLLPSLLITRITILFGSFKHELIQKLKLWGAAIIVIVVLVMCFSADYASFFRNNKNIRQLANPANFIYATLSYASSSNKTVIVKPIGEDAKLNTFANTHSKPTLFILVVGETARADHFSINGYNKPTTPLIAQQNIVNYSNVTSCGTETAVSVPCMFSNLGRDHYKDKIAKSQQGLLDIIQRSGYGVLWRDNNSTCKGTCDRVSYEDMQNLKVPELCNDSECFDNILLHQLETKLATITGNNKVIVLHQKGSHGPEYYRRYPNDMAVFQPVCRSNKLQDCSSEELNNAFDNTIHYTDYFLNSTIEWLKNQSATYNTAMIYLSDHGESLGEKNLYLHGMPYLLAPIEQKHIPFFFWFSEGFESENKINRTCLDTLKSNEYSQDNLFHTMLGLLNISTTLYIPALDMVQKCRI